MKTSTWIRSTNDEIRVKVLNFFRDKGIEPRIEEVNASLRVVWDEDGHLSLRETMDIQKQLREELTLGGT